MKYRGYWVNDNQVDENNHPPFPSDEIVNRGLGIGVIEEVYERQETLPKALPKQQQPLKRERRKLSVSPEGDKDGYLRACGCNRKH